MNPEDHWRGTIISEKMRSPSATSPKHTACQKQRHSASTQPLGPKSPVIHSTSKQETQLHISINLTMGWIEFTIQNLISQQECYIPIFIYGTCTTDIHIYHHILQDYEIHNILYYQAQKICTQRDKGIQVNHPALTSPIILYLKLSNGKVCQELQERIQAGHSNLSQ